MLRDVHSVEDDTRGKRADAVSGRNDDVACKTLVMTGGAYLVGRAYQERRSQLQSVR